MPPLAVGTRPAISLLSPAIARSRVMPVSVAGEGALTRHADRFRSASSQVIPPADPLLRRRSASCAVELTYPPTSPAVYEGITEGETIVPEASIARILGEWTGFQARSAVEGVQALPEWIE
jgi:hypothetical protein